MENTLTQCFLTLLQIFSYTDHYEGTLLKKVTVVSNKNAEFYIRTLSLLQNSNYNQHKAALK
jgi:hypothetical protein